MPSTTRSMAFPQSRRRHLFPSSSSSSLISYPFPSPPPTEPPVSPTFSSSSPSNSSSFNGSYSSNSSKSSLKRNAHFFLDSTSTTMEEKGGGRHHPLHDPFHTHNYLEVRDNHINNHVTNNINNITHHHHHHQIHHHIHHHTFTAIGREHLGNLHQHPQLRPLSEEEFLKIKSTMSVSALLNESSTPPDSLSQTSERYQSSSSFNPFDSGFETPISTAEQELQGNESDVAKPASPPQTPPRGMYIPQTELLDNKEAGVSPVSKQSKMATTMINTSLGQLFPKSQLGEKYMQAQQTQQVKQETTELKEQVVVAGVKTGETPTKTTPTRRASVRLAQSESPEVKKLQEAIKVQAVPRLKLKFKEQKTATATQPQATVGVTATNGSLGRVVPLNQLPVKRGRGRPRKLDPITGEPLAKKPKKTVAVDESGQPIIKRRKSNKGLAIKATTTRVKTEDQAYGEVDPFSQGDVNGASSTISAPPAPKPAVVRRQKRRTSSLDQTIPHPHIQRKQKIVNTNEESAPRPAKYDHGLGLSNLGATCYINVVVQVLAHTKPIRDYFLACDFARAPRKVVSPEKPKSSCVRRTRASQQTAKELFPLLKGKLGEQFGTLVRSLLFDEEGGKKHIMGIPSDQFWTALRANLEKENSTTPMDPNLVQDAHEFMMHILNALQVESDNPVVDGYTLPEIIDSSFAGVHATNFECNNCGETTSSEDKILDIQLPICRELPASGRLDNSTLHDHLQSYICREYKEWSSDDVVPQTGSGGESPPKVGCPGCGVDKGRSMWHTIRPRGESAVIELKRFFWDGEETKKVRGHIGFPMTGLDMSAYAGNIAAFPGADSSAPSPLYDLYGVVVHKGDRSTTGHYYAFAKEDGKWLRFDDLKVSVVNEKDVAAEEAYILMYQKAVPVNTTPTATTAVLPAVVDEAKSNGAIPASIEMTESTAPVITETMTEMPSAAGPSGGGSA